MVVARFRQGARSETRRLLLEYRTKFVPALGMTSVEIALDVHQNQALLLVETCKQFERKC